jgi:uncharacterized membrane protein
MTLSAALKRSFLAGLILITPLVVTLYLIRLLVNWSLQFVNPVVRGTRLVRYTADVEAVAQVVAVLLILAAITALGYLARQRVGREMFGNLGRIVNVIPLVGTIYTGVRQIANALVERDTAYKRAVLVEYPRADVYTIGLVTGESPAGVEEYVGEELYNVFLPHSPNPTAGRLVLVADEQIHDVDLSVRQGMRLVVTSGIGSDGADASLPKLDGSGE